jgi:exodeoxyribonuclease-3
MRLISWNVNSVRQRLPRLLALLARHDPDVVVLQETKVPDEEFPIAEVEAAGYHVVSFGQRGYNGVALLSLRPPTGVTRGFAGDPVPGESRVIGAEVDGVTVVGVYVVNGQEVGLPAYEMKLAWLDAFRGWVDASFSPDQPLVIAGDLNIAPDDRDVWDPALWEGKNLASEPERERLGRLMAWGLTDLGRRAAGDVPGPFTYWDYRGGAFHRGWGLRIDLALATAPLALRLEEVTVDREERKPSTGEGKPSDHAPLVVTFQDPL